MNLNQKGTLDAMLAVVLVTVVIVGGVVVYQAASDDNTTPDSSELDTEHENKASSGTNTYTSDEHNYSVKYPEDWAVTDETGDELRLLDLAPTLGNEETPQDPVISIGIDDTFGGNDSVEYIKNFAESDALTAPISEVSELFEVNGQPALSYGFVDQETTAYATLIDGPSGIFSIVHLDVALAEDGESTDIQSSAYYDEYIDIVNSFEIYGSSATE